jgi:hypothetical protein
MAGNRRWFFQHRKATVLAAAAVVLALAVVVDWPHRATAGDLRSDFATYATAVNGDLRSCSLEIEQTVSAYNQITAGVSTERDIATQIAAQTALDCTPMGNSAIEDLGTLQPPRSLARFHLDAGTQRLYAWCFSDGVDVAQEIEHLLAKPGDPALLARLHAQLADMQIQGSAAQQSFDRAAASLGAATVSFALDAIRPSVLVG